MTRTSDEKGMPLDGVRLKKGTSAITHLKKRGFSEKNARAIINAKFNKSFLKDAKDADNLHKDAYLHIPSDLRQLKSDIRQLEKKFHHLPRN